MPTPFEPFWGAVHSSLQEQLQSVSPSLWRMLPFLERVGRACCYLRLTRLLRAPPDSSATEGAVVAGCTLLAGSLFPSLEKGVKAVLAAQCAQRLFSQCVVLQKATWHVTILLSGRYPSPPPRLPFRPSLFSPSFVYPLRKNWQKMALLVSLLCKAVWEAMRALFSCALLLGEISLVMQGEAAIQFSLLSSLASPQKRVDGEEEDPLHSLTKEEEPEVDWMECIRIKCGLDAERDSSSSFSSSSSQVVGDSWRDLQRTVWSPGKITPFSLQFSPSVPPTLGMGRFPPIWQEDAPATPAQIPPVKAKRSLLGLFSSFLQ